MCFPDKFPSFLSSICLHQVCADPSGWKPTTARSGPVTFSSYSPTVRTWLLQSTIPGCDLVHSEVVSKVLHITNKLMSRQTSIHHCAPVLSFLFTQPLFRAVQASLQGSGLCLCRRAGFHTMLMGLNSLSFSYVKSNK